MKMIVRYTGLIVLMGLLVSCAGGNARKVLGIDKAIPDEFRVISEAPLAVPPDFNMRPPLPGAKRPQHTNLDDDAKATLLGDFGANNADAMQASPVRTAGEASLLNKAQGSHNPNIRKVLAEENRQKVQKENDKGFLESIVEYTHGKKEEEPVVDAMGEKKRISEKQQEGKPVTGEGTPEVEKSKEGGLLNRMLGL